MLFAVLCFYTLCGTRVACRSEDSKNPPSYHQVLKSVADRLHVLNVDDTASVYRELILMLGCEPTDDLINYLELSVQRKLVDEDEPLLDDQWYDFLCFVVMGSRTMRAAKKRKSYH